MKPKITDALNLLLLLGLAFLIWFYVQQQIIDTAEVEYKLNIALPPGGKFVLVSQSSETITVKLRGSKAQLAVLRGGEIKEARSFVNIDEARFANLDKPLQDKVKITDESLKLPANVTIVEPVSVDVWVDIVETKKCVVEPYSQNIRVEPAAVDVTGPRSLLRAKGGLKIKTQPVDEDMLKTAKDFRLFLIDSASEYRPELRRDLKLQLDPAFVMANLVVREKKKEIIRDVQITILGTPEFLANWKVEISGSATRTIRLIVDESRIEAAEQIKVELALDTSQLTPPGIPPAPLDLRVLNKPEWMDVEFVESGDRKVTITSIKPIKETP